MTSTRHSLMPRKPGVFLTGSTVMSFRPFYGAKSGRDSPPVASNPQPPGSLLTVSGSASRLFPHSIGASPQHSQRRKTRRSPRKSSVLTALAWRPEKTSTIPESFRRQHTRSMSQRLAPSPMRSRRTARSPLSRVLTQNRIRVDPLRPSPRQRFSKKRLASSGSVPAKQ